MAAYFADKVQATVREAAGLHDQVQGQRGLGDAVGELVGVPLALHITPVHVDGAEDAQINRAGNFVLEAVAGQRGVVGFDVDADFFFQAVLLQKSEHGGHVEVVLVLGRFTRLGLEQDGSLEADLVFVIHHHVQETAHLVQLLAHAGVEQGLVTFTSTPQHVIGTAQFQGRVHCFFHLERGERKNFRIRVGRRTRHEAAVAEQIGRAPEQADTAGFLLGRQHVDHGAHVIYALTRAAALGRYIAVVEAVVGGAEFAEKVKRRIGLGMRRRHGVCHVLPRPLKGAVVAEGVKAVPRKTVPVTHRKTQLLFHALAQHHAVFVIPAEGQRVVGLRPLVADRVYAVEIGLAHRNCCQLKVKGCGVQAMPRKAGYKARKRRKRAPSIACSAGSLR